MLSLKIYLDDCAYDKRLVQLLRQAGHEVTTPVEAGTLGQHDNKHLNYAIYNKKILLTKNPPDFLALHEELKNHCGIIAIYQDNDVSKDMTNTEIVKAISNLIKAQVPIINCFHILNNWRY